MDFARRHIDEKIVRMRIDVGDVGDAQLPPALNLTLGVDFIFNYDLQKFGFLASKSPRWPRSCAAKPVGRDRFPSGRSPIDCGRWRQSPAYALSARHLVLSPDDRPVDSENPVHLTRGQQRIRA